MPSPYPLPAGEGGSCGRRAAGVSDGHPSPFTMARQVDRHYKSFVAEVDDPGFFLAQPGEPPTEHAVLGKVCFGETPKPTRGTRALPGKIGDGEGAIASTRGACAPQKNRRSSACVHDGATGRPPLRRHTKVALRGVIFCEIRSDAHFHYQLSGCHVFLVLLVATDLGRIETPLR